MLLYKKLEVDNFEAIRSELWLASTNKVMTNATNKIRFWDEPSDWFRTNTPIFYKFIEDRKKKPIRLFRFYLTPRYDVLRPHIDGLVNHRSPIGLNIPIIGYQDTTMDWYNCPEDNIIDGNYGFNGTLASRVIDLNKLWKKDSTVIDCPTFVRTDIVHGITNYKSTPRLVLSMRFLNENHITKNFEDFWKI